MSKIIQIFKADDETDACNYRLISLLSNFNSIFEKIMYNRAKGFIDKHITDNLHPNTVLPSTFD